MSSIALVDFGLPTEGRNLTARGLSNAELREGWSDWLQAVFRDQPTELVTLTFAPRSYELNSLPGISRVLRAGRRFERQLRRSLANVSYFGVVERGGWNGRRHLHWIVSSEESSSIREALAAHQLREGFVDLSHRPGNVVEYVTKYVSKSDGDWWAAGGQLFERAKPCACCGKFDGVGELNCCDDRMGAG